MEGVNGEGGDGAGAGDEGDYCRQVEAYLCRKNDGHLIRIAGPSFTRVRGWAAKGIPLAVVYRGIDRYFERYYSRGPRRRPVQIDFCENDILDVFDEWGRAVGVSVAREGRPESPSVRRSEGPNVEGQTLGPSDPGTFATSGAVPPTGAIKRSGSLPAHIARVIVRLTTLRAGGRLTPEVDSSIAAAIREIDAARASAHVRGAARDALIARLRALDLDMLGAVRESIDSREWQAIERDAREQLAPFKGGMAGEAYERAVALTATHVLRERMGLPVIEYEDDGS